MTTIRAADIASASGGACQCGDWWRCRCPVHNRRTATLSVRDGDRALIVRCFALCPAAEVLAELRRTGIAGDKRRDYQEPVARAAVSTLGIAGFLMRSAVREVIIVADDRNGAGEHAVRGAAERWLADGRRVRIATPPASGTDFNDLLLGGVDASVAGEHHV